MVLEHLALQHVHVRQHALGIDNDVAVAQGLRIGDPRLSDQEIRVVPDGAYEFPVPPAELGLQLELGLQVQVLR